MARILAAPLVFLLAGTVALPAQPSADIVVTQNALEFNFHNVLWAEAWASRPVKAGELPMAGTPHFKGPIETHWKPFVDGKLGRDEAIKRIVADFK